VTAEIFSTTPLGEAFLVVTITLANTGNTALQPSLMDLRLEDATERGFPRAQEAEFILATQDQAVFPDRQIPPGTEVRAVLVFDVTAPEMPVRLAIHLPDQVLYSEPCAERDE